MVGLFTVVPARFFSRFRCVRRGSAVRFRGGSRTGGIRLHLFSVLFHRCSCVG